MLEIKQKALIPIITLLWQALFSISHVTACKDGVATAASCGSTDGVLNDCKFDIATPYINSSMLHCKAPMEELAACDSSIGAETQSGGHML